MHSPAYIWSGKRFSDSRVQAGHCGSVSYTKAEWLYQSGSAILVLRDKIVDRLAHASSENSGHVIDCETPAGRRIRVEVAAWIVAAERGQADIARPFLRNSGQCTITPAACSPRSRFSAAGDPLSVHKVRSALSPYSRRSATSRSALLGRDCSALPPCLRRDLSSGWPLLSRDSSP